MKYRKLNASPLNWKCSQTRLSAPSSLLLSRNFSLVHTNQRVNSVKLKSLNELRPWKMMFFKVHHWLGFRKHELACILNLIRLLLAGESLLPGSYFTDTSLWMLNDSREKKDEYYHKDGEMNEQEARKKKKEVEDAKRKTEKKNVRKRRWGSSVRPYFPGHVHLRITKIEFSVRHRGDKSFLFPFKTLTHYCIVHDLTVFFN